MKIDKNMEELEDSFETTPMMKQYLSVKAQYPSELLFFRMGDFFELFFEDAKIASASLNIALTTRNKHHGEDIPMCGVPIASVDYYLAKLVKNGFKVVVCDQVETPEEAKKRGGYKAVVKREIVKVVTPGTITEEPLLEAKSNNFLMSIVPNYNEKKAKISAVSFAVLDITTDEFYVNTVTQTDFLSELSRFSPKEILISDRYENTTWLNELKQHTESYITPLSDSKFNPITEQRRLEKYFNIATIDGIGITNAEEISACGAIIEYVQLTQCGNIPTISYPKRTGYSRYMVIDSSTAKNLEIVFSNSSSNNTLLKCLDCTATSFGGRMFASRLMTPLLSISDINNRLETIEFFMANKETLSKIRDSLNGCPDIERSFVRLKFGKPSVRDLCTVRFGFRAWSKIKEILYNESYKFEGKYSIQDIFDFSEIHKKIERALEEEIPTTNYEGRIIKSGFSAELDRLRELTNNSHLLIASLQEKYSKSLGISTLKIRNNNIWGWYIEVPLSQKSKMTQEFMHKQTLVNCVRYVTDELITLQEELNKSSAELAALENKILLDLIAEVTSFVDEFRDLTELLSILDISTAVAKISNERNYCKPELVEESILDIKCGRHPVLELALNDFVGNDCYLSEKSKLSLLTGPNMAGKSTYLRQNAVIILMAQAGLYVPATHAKIGITDRLFSRIGASDDLAKGRSTFMVEMIETATILNQATEKSFIILDEVGRGTSTYDGLSIAWAVVEHLNDFNKSRVIFATHYMELTAIKEQRTNLKCQTLKVQECNGNVVFFHTIIDGVADKSYGIHVAQLAGLPKSVIVRSKALLKIFEKSSINLPQNRQLSIFETSDNDLKLKEEENIKAQKQNSLFKIISDLNPDEMSPKDALEFIYKIKNDLINN